MHFFRVILSCWARQPGDIIDKINKTWRSKFNDFQQRVARKKFFVGKKLLWPRKKWSKFDVKGSLRSRDRKFVFLGSDVKMSKSKFWRCDVMWFAQRPEIRWRKFTYHYVYGNASQPSHARNHPFAYAYIQREMVLCLVKYPTFACVYIDSSHMTSEQWHLVSNGTRLITLISDQWRLN